MRFGVFPPRSLVVLWESGLKHPLPGAREQLPLPVRLMPLYSRCGSAQPQVALHLIAVINTQRLHKLSFQGGTVFLGEALGEA